MTAIEREGEAQSGVRVNVDGSGTATVGTGLPVLDHLLGLLAVHGGFDVQLEVAPGAAVLEAASAGRALGRALAEPLRAGRRHGTAVIPADEALAHVVLEASGRPLLVSNVDLSDARVAGLDTDIVARFLEGPDRGRRADAPRAPAGRPRHAARARRDLQGARHLARAGVPPATSKGVAAWPRRPLCAPIDAPAPLQGAPYSQAVRYGDLVFVAGQVGADAAGTTGWSATRSKSRRSRPARTSRRSSTRREAASRRCSTRRSTSRTSTTSPA